MGVRGRRLARPHAGVGPPPRRRRATPTPALNTARRPPPPRRPPVAGTRPARRGGSEAGTGRLAGKCGRQKQMVSLQTKPLALPAARLPPWSLWLSPRSRSDNQSPPAGSRGRRLGHDACVRIRWSDRCVHSEAMGAKTTELDSMVAVAAPLLHFAGRIDALISAVSQISSTQA